MSELKSGSLQIPPLIVAVWIKEKSERNVMPGGRRAVRAAWTETMKKEKPTATKEPTTEDVRPNGRVRLSRVLLWTAVIVATALAVYLFLKLLPKDDMDVDSLLQETSNIPIETESETEKPANPVPRPDIDEQLLTINDWSRPGEKTEAIEYVVIHYLANPKTSAQQNHDYFESLKDLQDVSMSANFIVGLEGEIIECVPPGEIAYASNSMNVRSVSIENCHLDDSGRFTVETYESCVRLAAWLVAEYGLDREHIIRHYDVNGKKCPLYYVENEDKWEQFKDDVMSYIEECKEAAK